MHRKKTPIAVRIARFIKRAGRRRLSQQAPVSVRLSAERSAIFVQLAELAQESVKDRKAYEWKVAFGLWTAIGLVTYFATENRELLSLGTLVVMGILFLLIQAAWTLLWQLPLHRAFETDKRFKHFYMDKAEGRDPPAPVVPGLLEIAVGHWTWAWGQAAITFLFLIGAMVVMIAASCTKKSADYDVNLSSFTAPATLPAKQSL